MIDQEGAAPDEVRDEGATQLSVLPTPQPAPTGVPAVDAALARLGDLADLTDRADPDHPDAAAHAEVFEDVHAHLQEALDGSGSE